MDINYLSLYTEVDIPILDPEYHYMTMLFNEMLTRNKNNIIKQTKNNDLLSKLFLKIL